MQEGLDGEKSKLMPVFHLAGLVSLNDDVLRETLLWVHANGNTQTLQQACRPFRKRALAMPELWTNVTTEKNALYYLERSRAHSLNIAIYTDKKLYMHTPRDDSDSEMGISLHGTREALLEEKKRVKAVLSMLKVKAHASR